MRGRRINELTCGEREVASIAEEVSWHGALVRIDP